MKIVVFDVDGVLADWTYSFRVLANQHFGVPIYHTGDQISWNMGDITKTQEAFLWDHVRESDKFWVSIPSLLSKQQRYRISDLVNNPDRQVYFVTSRVGDSAKFETELWVANMIGDVRFPTVIVSNRKHEIISGIGADFSIEDKFENAITIGNANRKTKSYLLNYPANAGFNSDYVIRIDNLDQYLDVVEA